MNGRMIYFPEILEHVLIIFDLLVGFFFGCIEDEWGRYLFVCYQDDSTVNSRGVTVKVPTGHSLINYW